MASWSCRAKPKTGGGGGGGGGGVGGCTDGFAVFPAFVNIIGASCAFRAAVRIPRAEWHAVLGT